MSATPSLVLSQGNRAARSPKFRIRRQRGELRRPNRGSRCAPRRQEKRGWRSRYSTGAVNSESDLLVVLIETEEIASSAIPFAGSTLWITIVASDKAG